MRLKIEKEDLMNAVNIVLKAVPARTTMPILECILIDATSDDILLMANDMEMGIETQVEGDILEKGKTAVEAKLFSDMIHQMPDGEITIDCDANMSITITNGDFRYSNLPGRSGEEFPYLPLIEKEEYISISQLSLRDVIRQTIFSTSPGDLNKLMTGELFEVNEDELKVTSLDGHRISIRRVMLRDTYPSQKVVVPGKTLNEISKILGGNTDKDVLIFFTKNNILFEFDRTVIVSRLIEGEYFKISQMLSADYETKITVNRKKLQDTLEKSLVLLRENDKKPIIMNMMNQILNISLNTSLASMSDDIKVDKKGKDIMIAFNPRYLIDALRAIDDENVDLYLSNSREPCFIRDQDENYNYLILPVNFNHI